MDTGFFDKNQQAIKEGDRLKNDLDATFVVVKNERLDDWMIRPEGGYGNWPDDFLSKRANELTLIPKQEK